MESAVAVSKIVTFGFARFLLIIHLDVAVAVIHEDADLTWGQFTAFLNPCDLTIVINWLHTIATDTNTKISSIRDRTLRERDSFKILFIEECTSTSRNGKRADWHINAFFFIGVPGNDSVFSGSYQIVTILAQLPQSFWVQLCGSAREEGDIFVYAKSLHNGNELIDVRNRSSRFP